QQRLWFIDQLEPGPLYNVAIALRASGGLSIAVLSRVFAEVVRRHEVLPAGLLRVRAWRLGAAEHLVLVAMHHIVGDGWSLGVLVQEVAALYRAFSRGEASPLAELPVQYADFALWQRDWLSGEVLERQLAYWREHLAGAPPV